VQRARVGRQHQVSALQQTQKAFERVFAYQIERRLLPEYEGTKMFVQDGSDYRAVLYTVADFSCAHFEVMP
jgi:hypothetical protein